MTRDIGVKLYFGDEAVDAFDPPLPIEECDDLDEIAEVMRQRNELAFAALRAWLEWFRRECNPREDT